VQRRGQAKFRQILLSIYRNQCQVTGCDVTAALEAAHIIPYQGESTNHVKNGLLLRADIHTLFDLHLITINPETYEILLSSNLSTSSYQELHGKLLSLPQDKAFLPEVSAMRKHYKRFLEVN
jgi:putative restriction endonuclease